MLVALMAYTGMRPGEALALRWGDVGERTIRVERAVSLCDGSTQGTKTDTSRTVRLLAPLAADLAAWRLRCGRPAMTALVLPHPSGHPWSKTAWGNWRRRDFNPAREAAGIGALRPYDLRHTFASLLLAKAARSTTCRAARAQRRDDAAHLRPRDRGLSRPPGDRG